MFRLTVNDKLTN